MRLANKQCGREPERVHVEMHAHLIFEHPEDEPAAAVVLRDMSTDGARLMHSNELPEHMRLLLQLPSIQGSSLSIHAHVVESRMLEPGRFRIGLQFDTHDPAVIGRLRDALLL
jgi:hypothetical protein